jgi:peptidoglycan hydrolase CwlO-like protein
MGKFFAGAFLVLILAVIAFFVWSKVNDSRREQLEAQITQMNNMISQLGDENTRLKGELAKVQSEEQTLAAHNDELRKAIASVKATGKLPPDVNLELNPPK